MTWDHKTLQTRHPSNRANNSCLLAVFKHDLGEKPLLLVTQPWLTVFFGMCGFVKKVLCSSLETITHTMIYSDPTVTHSYYDVFWPYSYFLILKLLILWCVLTIQLFTHTMMCSDHTVTYSYYDVFWPYSYLLILWCLLTIQLLIPTKVTHTMMCSDHTVTYSY